MDVFWLSGAEPVMFVLNQDTPIESYLWYNPADNISSFLTRKHHLFAPQNPQPKWCCKYFPVVGVPDFPVSQDSEYHGAIS